MKVKKEHKSAGVNLRTAIRAGHDVDPNCSFPAPGPCTRDINECGNPSNCGCGINPAYVYNPATGYCDNTDL